MPSMATYRDGFSEFSSEISLQETGLANTGCSEDYHLQITAHVVGSECVVVMPCTTIDNRAYTHTIHGTTRAFAYRYISIFQTTSI